VATHDLEAGSSQEDQERNERTPESGELPGPLEEPRRSVENRLGV
jgi:hypothetical protein